MDDIDESDVKSACLVTHLHPEDFPTVSAGMKAVVSSFIDKEDGKEYGMINPHVEGDNKINGHSKAEAYIFSCGIRYKTFRSLVQVSRAFRLLVFGYNSQTAPF